MNLIQKLIRPEVLAQTAYHVPDSKDMLKLDAMENPYPLPAVLREELGVHLSHVALNRYPVPDYAKLKQKICREFGVPQGFDVVLGNGSDELISMLSVACARPGAKVIAPIPTFVMYAVSAQLAGLEFIGVPLQPDFTLDLPALLTALREHRPALLYLANPNNPTGGWYQESDLIQLIQAMSDIGLVVVDEAYQPFAPGTMMARLPEFGNLIVMRTVSKLGWAGLRLGYMSASGALLAEIEKVRPPYNINVLTAAAAEFLLDHMPVFEAQAGQIRAQREALCDALNQFEGVQVFPSMANFVLIRVPNSEQIFNKLLEHKILVKNVGKMHSLLSGCLRITVSTPQENQQFLKALSDALR